LKFTDILNESDRKTLINDFAKKATLRPSKTKYYLGIAEAVSARSTCLRRQYGAIVVKNDEILSTGYNGAPRGEDNCCDKGYCWRELNNVPHGEMYEKCVAVHAEQNALLSASRKDMLGGTLYLVGIENGERIKAQPCLICQRLIQNAGLTVVTEENDAE